MLQSVLQTLKGAGPYPVGIGLKSQHYAEILDSRPPVSFFEIHAENYMSAGGAHHRYLSEITSHYPLSIHGVGLSLGSADGVDTAHLNRLADVVERYNPWLVSEHLAWSVNDGTYFNDLLPLPYTEESLSIVADNISRTQDRLGRQLMIENPSSYMAFASSSMPELEFLIRLANITGCLLLVDVNNIYVSACNNSWSVEDYINNIPADIVGEIHLAGHSERNIEGTILRIDDHGSSVCDAVWALYSKLVGRIGMRPTLIEWDNNIPDLNVWIEQARTAQKTAEVALTNVRGKARG